MEDTLFLGRFWKEWLVSRLFHAEIMKRCQIEQNISMHVYN
jgi:hypothetical protein